eukprot:CAMPEP_0184485390 /NCGR_PEP_ID=MMETSP0113_2-20130426/6999_1 /TAXON_ID=91329 /ORGANISM="Norrisiella sphaerica, Strain BC52" /LENGTH=570 /DNA_ID=CAMNT_0026866813 /DNA_START=34 /DNA_END=1743 /DNA_ORIENTATION=+
MTGNSTPLKPASQTREMTGKDEKPTVIINASLSPPKILPMVDEMETPEIPFDESVTGKIRFWRDAPHLALYVDDYTVMEEVTDLTLLRKGDHCIVGLNPVRKLCGCCDALVFRLASLEVLRLYHHFIMFDDVVSVTEEGVPLNSERLPASICEYSNTPLGAIQLFMEVGPKKFFANPAPFQQLTLHDYQDGRSAFGIFRVVGNISNHEREQIVREAKELMDTFQPYDIIFRNCEHAAWGLDAGRRLWVSPQIPWMLYNFARLVVQVLGCLILLQIESCRKYNACGPRYMGGIHFAYHVVTTLPVALQVLVSLVRSVVLLTEQKETIGELSYFFLLTKEVARAAIAGGLSIAILALLPQLVWNIDWVCTAMVLVMTTYFTCDVVFNLSFVLATRCLNGCGVGVPVAIFASKRHLHIGSEISAFPDADQVSLKRNSPDRKSEGRFTACNTAMRIAAAGLVEVSGDVRLFGGSRTEHSLQKYRDRQLSKRKRSLLQSRARSSSCPNTPTSGPLESFSKQSSRFSKENSLHGTIEDNAYRKENNKDAPISIEAEGYMSGPSCERSCKFDASVIW